MTPETQEIIMKHVAIAVSSLLVLAGCNSLGGPNQTGGTLIGAGGGALLGSQIGGGSGRVAGAALGAVGGALLGGYIGKEMDQSE
jgi:uncharacterized protein YcfJ